MNREHNGRFTHSISTRDTLLAAIPFAGLFFLSIFRLDQILAAPKGGRRIAPAACGVDEQGEPILCDPTADW